MKALSTMKSPKNSHDYASLLESGRWFRALPTELRQRILDSAIVRNFPPGQKLFSRGDAFSGLYAVLEGSIRVTGLTENGKEALLTIIDPPNWFGEIALFDSQERTHDAIAEEESTVLQVPKPALDKILCERPEWWQDFGRLLTHKLRLAFVALEDMALLPASLRLARRLLLIAEDYGNLQQDRSRKVINLHQEQLGMMLAISRQTTNQILKELEAQGILKVSYGEIEIRDLEKLRALGTSHV